MSPTSRLLAALLVCLAVVPAAVADDKFAYVDTFRDATAEERALTSVPYAPGAAAVVLNWTQIVNDRDSYRTEYVRIKVLADQGKKYGDVEIPHVPLLNTVNRIRARTIRPDGTIVPWNGKTFDKVILKIAGGRVVAKTFTLPDVEVGSILEYRFDIANRDNRLYDSRFTIERELPILQEYLLFKAYERGPYASYYSFKGLPGGKKPVKNGDTFTVELENVPPFEEEPHAPPAADLQPELQFWYTAENLSTDAFWTKQAREWADVVEPFAGDGRAVKEIAAAATAGATTPEDKLRRLYARVQQVRNLSWEPDKTEEETRKLRDNNSAQDVLRNGYGYIAQINRTFIALARAAGFDAHAVRLGERDERYMAKELPLARQLDGEITVVNLDGKPLYLDPGTLYAPFGVLAWQKTAVPAIVIQKKVDKVAWILTPPEPVEDAVTRRVADLQLDNGVLRGKITVTYRGQDALRERLKLREDDDAAARKSLEETMKSWFADGSSVKVTELRDLRAAEAPFVVVADVELPSAASLVGARVLVPLSVFGANQKSPFTAEQRKWPVYFRYAYRVDDDVTLHLPAGYTVESLPLAINDDRGALRYTAAYDRKAEALHLTRGVVVDAVLIAREKYPAVRSFFSEVVAGDQQQLLLRKAAN